MKIFFNPPKSCCFNYQHDLILYQLSINNFEFTKDVKEADIIIIPTFCTGSYANILENMHRMVSILENKKNTAKTYLTGCITRQFKDDIFLSEFSKWVKDNIDYIIPQNQPNLLLKLISEDIFGTLDINDFGMVKFDNDDLVGEIFISNGCLNKCSFCKVTYQNYPLKSLDINEVKEQIDKLDDMNMSTIIVKGTNVCQYGLDLYNEYMLPEIIDYFEKKKNINKVIYEGFAFKDAIKNDFQSTIANSTKVGRLCGSLESGSDRILKLMRKGFTSDEIINFFNDIRKKRFIELYSVIIAGFPTETIEDAMMTLKVLKELKASEVDICRYTNSSFVDSNCYEQLSPSVIQEHTRIYSKVLKKRSVKTRINSFGYKLNDYKYN